MNIAMLTPEFNSGGTEVYIESLSRQLLKRNVKVICISSGGIRENNLKKIGIEHIKIDSINKKRPKNFVKSMYTLKRILDEEDIDIIHASSIYMAIVARLTQLLFLKSCKVVLTLHGGPTEGLEQKVSKIINLLKIQTIAITDDSKNKLIKYGAKPSLITKIHNGIDTELIDKSISKKRENNDNTINIGFFGRLTKQKGIDILIDAFECIVKERGNIILNIVGTGDLEYDIKSKVTDKKLDKVVKFYGFVNSPYEIMSKMDLILIPSRWEPFGLVAAEAMYLEKNIIASKVDGLIEVIGNTGDLVESIDKVNLYNAINKKFQLNDFPKNTKAKERVIKYFTLDKMTEKVLDLYKEILAK